VRQGVSRVAALLANEGLARVVRVCCWVALASAVCHVYCGLPPRRLVVLWDIYCFFWAVVYVWRVCTFCWLSTIRGLARVVLVCLWVALAFVVCELYLGYRRGG
jgi:hypothetical protein